MLSSERTVRQVVDVRRSTFDGQTLGMQVRGMTTATWKGQIAGSALRAPEDTSVCKRLRVFVEVGMRSCRVIGGGEQPSQICEQGYQRRARYHPESKLGAAAH